MTLAVQKSVTSWAGRLVFQAYLFPKLHRTQFIGERQYVGIVVRLRVDDVSSTPTMGEDVNKCKHRAPLHSPPLD
jgi:hypothetical protein